MYYLYLWIEKFWKVTSSPPTFKKKKKEKTSLAEKIGILAVYVTVWCSLYSLLFSSNAVENNALNMSY